jgi:hypothetical protein
MASSLSLLVSRSADPPARPREEIRSTITIGEPRPLGAALQIFDTRRKHFELRNRLVILHVRGFKTKFRTRSIPLHSSIVGEGFGNMSQPADRLAAVPDGRRRRRRAADQPGNQEARRQ